MQIGLLREKNAEYVKLLCANWKHPVDVLPRTLDREMKEARYDSVGVERIKSKGFIFSRRRLIWVT
jgi:hypothetical protein